MMQTHHTPPAFRWQITIAQLIHLKFCPSAFPAFTQRGAPDRPDQNDQSDVTSRFPDIYATMSAVRSPRFLIEIESMMQRPDWRTRFAREMKMAEKARLEGNEGKARVCARRAAGIVADEFMKRSGVSTPNMTAYERIKLLGAWPGVPEGVGEVVAHMTTRVNTSYELPVDADLVAEARWLAEALLTEDASHSARKMP